jgi:hypothetical protein
MTKGLSEGDLLTPCFIASYIKEEDGVESVTLRRSKIQKKWVYETVCEIGHFPSKCN